MTARERLRDVRPGRISFNQVTTVGCVVFSDTLTFAPAIRTLSSPMTCPRSEPGTGDGAATGAWANAMLLRMSSATHAATVVRTIRRVCFNMRPPRLYPVRSLDDMASGFPLRLR